MLIEVIKPEYGKNYRKGDIGFTYNSGSLVSEGIAYFTRWERMSDIRVSHCFVVAAQFDVIEALPDGISRTDITRYFNNPKINVFFRKPNEWTPQMGEKIVTHAATHIGTEYDWRLDLAHGISGSMMGHLATKITGDAWHRRVCEWMNDPKKWMCSEMGSDCLQAIPILRPKGCLQYPACTISPQELFEDNDVFEAWKKEKKS